MERLRLTRINDSDKRSDLRAVHSDIIQEPNLLHPSLSELEESFDRGLAVALVSQDSNEAVGFVRFSPLLEDELKDGLGLNNFPSIWEIGTAVILPQFRGRGWYAPLRKELLVTVSQDIKEGRLLVLGTTKSIAIIKVLKETKDLGIDFYKCVHTDFPMIVPFTCVCRPDFGCGFQLTEECPVRVTQQQLLNLDSIAQKSDDGTKIPCVMYVSDKSLAERIDKDLMVKFGNAGSSPQQNLVRVLKERSYYDQ